jgi:hypothetical protein
MLLIATERSNKPKRKKLKKRCSPDRGFYEVLFDDEDKGKSEGFF